MLLSFLPSFLQAFDRVSVPTKMNVHTIRRGKKNERRSIFLISYSIWIESLTLLALASLLEVFIHEFIRQQKNRSGSSSRVVHYIDPKDPFFFALALNGDGILFFSWNANFLFSYLQVGCHCSISVSIHCPPNCFFNHLSAFLPLPSPKDNSKIINIDDAISPVSYTHLTLPTTPYV